MRLGEQNGQFGPAWACFDFWTIVTFSSISSFVLIVFRPFSSRKTAKCSGEGRPEDGRNATEFGLPRLNLTKTNTLVLECAHTHDAIASHRIFTRTRVYYTTAVVRAVVLVSSIYNRTTKGSTILIVLNLVHTFEHVVLQIYY